MSLWSSLKNGITIVADFVKAIAGYRKEIQRDIQRPLKTPVPIPVPIQIKSPLDSGGKKTSPPPKSPPKRPPVDWNKINKAVRRAVRSQWVIKGFRDTSRLQHIANRMVVSGNQAPTMLSIKIDHACLSDGNVFQNYEDHEVKESAVLHILHYGRKRRYTIPSKGNSSAKKFLVWQHGVLHFWNWRVYGKITIPNRGMLAKRGEDPYGVKQVAREAIMKILKDYPTPIRIRNVI